MHVILIAIGMHTKPCIASLTFTACNWELLCNTDLILVQKKGFSAQNMMVRFYKCAIMSGFRKSVHIYINSYALTSQAICSQLAT